MKRCLFYCIDDETNTFIKNIYIILHITLSKDQYLKYLMITIILIFLIEFDYILIKAQ